jgi:hypothetical protein
MVNGYARADAPAESSKAARPIGSRGGSREIVQPAR